MLRLKNLANKYQKRTCRPLYANTQATPYAATLDSSFRVDGALTLPTGAFTLKGSLVPGMVVTRVANSEGVKVAQPAHSVNAANGKAQYPFGLLANFVGGDLDEGFSGDSLQNSVGVWRGPDSVFEILAPAFVDDPTVVSGDSDTLSITSAISGATAPGTPVLLYSGADGRLTADSGDGTNTGGNRIAVARLVEYVSPSRITVDLLV